MDAEQMFNELAEAIDTNDDDRAKRAVIRIGAKVITDLGRIADALEGLASPSGVLGDLPHRSDLDGIDTRL
jgi:hypothetical protein